MLIWWRTNQHLGKICRSPSYVWLIREINLIFLVLFEKKKLWIFLNEVTFYFLTTMICNMDTNSGLTLWFISFFYFFYFSFSFSIEFFKLFFAISLIASVFISSVLFIFCLFVFVSFLNIFSCYFFIFYSSKTHWFASYSSHYCFYL